MDLQRDSDRATLPLVSALVAALVLPAACAEEPTSLSSSSSSGATGAGGASGSGVGQGGDLGEAHVLFFGAEADPVSVETDEASNPASVGVGEARLFTLHVDRDCPSGVERCVAFTRSGESDATRLKVGTGGLLVHVFAGDDDLDDDVTIDASEVLAPGDGKAAVYYRSLVSFIDYGVLDEGGAFVPFKDGFNQLDVDEQVASYDSDSGIVRIELPEPLEAGMRYAVVVGEEPAGHFLTYCALDGAEETCATFTSDVGG